MKLEDERTKLFNEVWSEPVTTVAERYGLSDNGLRKRCIKLQIPLPPVGYWAKVKAGVTVAPKPKLLALKVKQEAVVLKDAKHEHEIEFIDINSLSTEELKNLEGLDMFTPHSREVFVKWCGKIQVPKKNDLFHPLIIEYQQEIEYRKTRNKEHQFRDIFQFRDVAIYSKVKYRPDQLVLPIHVSDKLSNRACQVVDTLIKAIEELGGKVTVEKFRHDQRQAGDNAAITLFKKSFSFIVREAMAKRREVLQDTSGENKVREFQPMYQKVFTGKLELEIRRISDYWEKQKQEQFSIFADSSDVALENQLGGAFKWMARIVQEEKIAWVIYEREENIKARERERQREIEAENQNKLQASLAMEKRQKQLIENIEQQMDSWYRSKKLRQYAEEIEAYAKLVGDPESQESLERYVMLVQGKAETSDPIAKIVQEIKAIGVKTELP